MRRIFVSSTFKDFQMERDTLQKIVLPKLNSISRETSEYFMFQDLRWGIDTESVEAEEQNSKVINYCLDEIERCKPFFILLLGNNYGYKPSEELIKREANRHNLVLDDYNISITELEFRYAEKLLGKQKENILFFFRNTNGDVPEKYIGDDDEQKHLTKLKNYILKKYKDQVREYTISFNSRNLTDNVTGLENFGELIFDGINKVILKEKINDENIFSEPYLLESHNFLTNKANYFYARQKEINFILRYIKEERKEEAVIITGEDGCGTTMLLARIYESLRQTNNKTVPIVCGLNKEFSSAKNILYSLVCYFSKIYNLEISGEDISDQYFNCLKLANEKNETIFILIDDYDHLMFDLFKNNFSLVVPNLKNIVFIVSMYKENGLLLKQGCKVIDIGELSNDDVCETIDRTLMSLGKELHPAVKDAIKQKNSSKNPLCLKLIISIVSMFEESDYEKLYGKKDFNLSAYQIEEINKIPDSLEKIVWYFLRKIARDNNESKLIMYNFGLCYEGLSLKELDCIAHLCLKKKVINRDNFYNVINYVPELFYSMNDDSYCFTHRVFKKAVISNLPDVNGKRALNLYLYLMARQLNDEKALMIYSYLVGKIDEAFEILHRNYDSDYFETMFDVIIKDQGNALKDYHDYVLDNLNDKKTYVLTGFMMTKVASHLYQFFSDYKDKNRKVAIKILENLSMLYEEILPNILTLKPPFEVFFCDTKYLLVPHFELRNAYMSGRTKEDYLKALECSKKEIELYKIIANAYDENYEKYTQLAISEFNYLHSIVSDSQNENNEEIELILQNNCLVEIEDQTLLLYAHKLSEFVDMLRINHRKDKLLEMYNCLEKSLEFRKEYIKRNNLEGERLPYLKGLNDLLRLVVEYDSSNHSKILELTNLIKSELKLLKAFSNDSYYLEQCLEFKESKVIYDLKCENKDAFVFNYFDFVYDYLNDYKNNQFDRNLIIKYLNNTILFAKFGNKFLNESINVDSKKIVEITDNLIEIDATLLDSKTLDAAYFLLDNSTINDAVRAIVLVLFTNYFKKTINTCKNRNVDVRMLKYVIDKNIFHCDLYLSVETKNRIKNYN